MELKFDEKGLMPVITQDFRTMEVLMLAYMNIEAFRKTIETGKVHYYSRSRKALWLKGETSGHFQFVKDIYFDCDSDSLLIKVEQVGAACHTNNKTCFYQRLDNEGGTPEFSSGILFEIFGTIIDRKENPKSGSYTNYLLDKGIDKTLKKVGEESAEVIIAAKNNEKSEIIYEFADLCYHLSVLLVQTDLTWQDVFNELGKRR